MWTSHPPSNINPRAPDCGTPESNPWTNGKTPRDYQNDTRMQIQILLPWTGKKNQTVGNAMRGMHQIQENQQQPNQTENDQQYGTRPRSGRYPRNRHTAKSAKLCRISKHCHDD